MMAREMDDCDDAIREAFGETPPGRVGDSRRVLAEAPMRLLRRMLKAGCEVSRLSFDSGHQISGSRTECHYCGETLDVNGEPADDHAPDCPYVEAITLYGDPDGTKPAGILKA